MPRRTPSYRGTDSERRFERIEEWIAELQNEIRGEVWWELWELSKRVMALERTCKPQKVRHGNRTESPSQRKRRNA